MSDFELINPMTGKLWCVVKDDAITLEIHDRKHLDALTEWEDTADAGYVIKFKISTMNVATVIFSAAAAEVWVPHPNPDPSAPYFQITPPKVILHTTKARFLEALKRVDAYLTKPYVRKILREVSPGVAEIDTVYRGIEYWQSLSDASPRCGACVEIVGDAECPSLVNGLLRIPTDVFARHKPFRVDSNNLAVMNVRLTKIEDWIKQDSENVTILKALIRDAAFVKSRPTAERHLLKALRAVMQD